MRSEVFKNLRRDFQVEEARYAYSEDFVNTYIAAQIKNLREERNLNQGQLAEMIGTKQSGVSRLENINYSAWKVESLRKLARAFGLWLKISFEEFGELPKEIDGFKKSLSRRSFSDDPVFQSTGKNTAAENRYFDRRQITETLNDSFVSFDAGSGGATSISYLLGPGSNRTEVELHDDPIGMPVNLKPITAYAEMDDPVVQPPPDKYRRLQLMPPAPTVESPLFFGKRRGEVWTNHKPNHPKRNQRKNAPLTPFMQTTPRLKQVSGT